MKRLIHDRKGVLYTFIAVAVFTAAILILWFPLSWVVYTVIDTVTTSFTYPPEAQGTITLMKNVVAWFIDIAVGGFILWAYTATQRRAPYTEAY